VDYLLTNEAALLLKRTPDAVRAMERSGKLSAVRVGHVRLFSRREIETVLREREKRQRELAANASVT
jgi:excisionase family DNA binding protein